MEKIEKIVKKVNWEQEIKGLIAEESLELLLGNFGEEQKQLQNRVNFALKFVDEVGNPLTAMDGAIDLLFQCWQEQSARAGMDSLRSQEVVQCFRILHEQTQRMESLLQSIRRFAILTGRKNDFTDANEIIETISALLQMENYEQGIAIVRQLDSAIPAIKLEQSIVVFCLYSSLSTLMEACTQGGKVIIKSIADKDEVGILIECQDLASDLTTQSTNGLSSIENACEAIRAVVDKHGGRVSLSSASNNHCSIHLALPAKTD